MPPDPPSVPPLAAEDHVCPSCPLSYMDLDVAAARAMVVALPGRLREAVVEVAEPRRRPEPDRWSAVEYACHLRDVAVTYTIRLHRVRTEDRPVLEPMLNDLRARRFRYAEADLPSVVDEIGRVTRGLADEIDRVAGDGWSRTATRLPGEERTALWLVRQAAHECVHHVRDVVGADAGSGDGWQDRSP